MPNNIQKRKAQPKRSITTPGDNHIASLWIDYGLLRKHQGRSPEIVLHSPHIAVNNRYLAMTDIALGNNKPKKKSKSASGTA